MGERINKGSMKTWGRGREGEDGEKAKKKGRFGENYDRLD